jgi:hypothetical protein
MTTITIIIIIAWSALYLWAGLKMSVVISAIISAWFWASQDHTSTNLMLYIWLFFMGLAILDVLQSKKIRENYEQQTEDEKQVGFNHWLAAYKRHINDDNDNESE